MAESGRIIEFRDKDTGVVKFVLNLDDGTSSGFGGGGEGGSPSGPAGGDLAGTYPNPTLAGSSVEAAAIAAGAVDLSHIAAGLKPSGTAAAGDESLRAIGTTASTAAAGNHSHAELPSAGEKAALVGTNGTPSGANAFVTNSDARLVGLPPTGAAGGVLSGTYPDPGFAADMADQAELDAVAALGVLHGLATDQHGVTNANLLSAGQKTNATAAAAAGTASIRAIGTSGTEAAAGNDTRFPAGADIVAGDIAAALKSPAAGVEGLRTLSTTGTSAAAGNDARLSDSRGVLGWTPLFEGPLATISANDAQKTNCAIGTLMSTQASPSTSAVWAYPIYAADLNVSGKTTQIMIELVVLTNATAAISFTAGISIQSVAGGANALSITWGAPAGNIATVTTPAASSVTRAVSTAFTIPSDGMYAPTYSMSAAMPITNPKAALYICGYYRHT